MSRRDPPGPPLGRSSPLQLMTAVQTPTDEEEATRRSAEVALHSGRRVREVRESQGRTLKEVAARLNITPQQLGRLEEGKRTLRPDMLRAIASALSVPVRTLETPGEPGASRSSRRGGIADHKSEIEEAFKSLGYDVGLPITTADGSFASLDADLIAALHVGPVVHRLAIQCRTRVMSAVEIAAFRGCVDRHPHAPKPVIVVEVEPARQVVADAGHYGVGLIVLRDLLMGLVDFGAYAEGLKKRQESLQGWFVAPRATLEDEPTSQPLHRLVDTWRSSALSRALLILGEPGSGKSTSALWLAICLAARHLAEPRDQPIPVLIRLRRVSPSKGLRQLILEDLRTAGRGPVQDAALLRLIANGRFVFVLDGFDEMSVRPDPFSLREHLRELREFLRSGSWVIVTSRPGAFRDSREVRELFGLNARGASVVQLEDPSPPMTVMRLADLDRSQMLEMIAQRSNADHLAVAEAIQRLGLEPLARRPLVLGLLCDNADLLRRLMDRSLTTVGLAGILRAHIDAIVDREAAQSVPREALLDALSELAVEMMIRNVSSLHIRQLPQHLGDVLARRPTPLLEMSAMDMLVRRSAFGERDEEGNWSFAHRLYQDYLVAWRICEDVVNDRPDRVRLLWIDASESAVLREMLREAPLPAQLRRWLSSTDEEIRAISAFLIGVAGLEADTEALRRVSTSDRSFGVRNAASYALVVLGDREMLRTLVTMATATAPSRDRTNARIGLMTLMYVNYPGVNLNEHHKGLTETISRWVDDEVLEDILEVAADEDAGDTARGAAATVLGRVGAPAVFLPALAALNHREGQRLRIALNKAIEELRLRSGS